MPLGVPDDHEAGVVGRLPPFVEVQGDGSGPLQAGELRRQGRRHHAQRAAGPVDVEVQAFGFGQVGQGRQVVDGANVDRPRRSDQQEGSPPLQPVGADHRSRGADVDPPGRVRRRQAQGVRAQSRHVHGPRHAVVRAARRVGCQLRAPRTDPGSPRPDPEGCAAGHQHRDEVGYRGARDE